MKIERLLAIIVLLAGLAACSKKPDPAPPAPSTTEAAPRPDAARDLALALLNLAGVPATPPQ